MFFNKNGLKINLNFDQSINENELSELESKNVNKNIIRKESAIFFSQASKSITVNTTKEKLKLLSKYSYNFPIISKIKITPNLIINKTIKFQILKSTKIIEPCKRIFEIIKINDINIIIPKKIVETEINKDLKEEKNVNSIIERKLFKNLDIFNNNIFIEGKKKQNYIIDIQNKINDIELPGKPRRKSFEDINISSKVSDVIIEQTKFNKESDIKHCEVESFEIKSKPNISQNIKKALNNEATNIISFSISGLSKLKEEKILSIENNINNFEIIHKIKGTFKNLFAKRIINFDIKTQKKKKKKSPHLILRKVEGFNNINNKLFIKDINNKEMLSNENETDNNDINKKKSENKKEIKSKVDKYKTKSPSHIEIKIKNNNYNNQDINNLNLNENIDNNTSNKLKINKIITSNKDNKNKITINTINNEIIYNKQSIDFPIINTDIIHFEEQYEKIKKELNELYPIINRNKKYRENFFMQLSQGNRDKYIFYLDLYKIIKDEQEEKNNNNLENYLKMKKIIGNKHIEILNNRSIKNKLRPLKRNKSSHFIFAKDKNKIRPLFTDL